MVAAAEKTATLHLSVMCVTSLFTSALLLPGCRSVGLIRSKRRKERGGGSFWELGQQPNLFLKFNFFARRYPMVFFSSLLFSSQSGHV